LGSTGDGVVAVECISRSDLRAAIFLVVGWVGVVVMLVAAGEALAYTQ